ncbi:MAG: LamG-like jellyroll fold domain-containing protein, partial [Sedimentisphaerales bacterium]
MYRKLTYLISFVLVLAVFYSTAEAQKDLILWFPFEGSGDVAEDASGNGNDGKIVGAERVPGKYGKGIAIGKKDQYVEISNVLQPAATIAFWFKPNWAGSDPETYRLFDANTGAIYYMIGKGKETGGRQTTFGFYLEDASDADFQDWQIPATDAIPSAGQWYHIATTWDFDAGNAFFYINGEEVGSVPGLGQFPPLNANPKIGFNVGTGYMPAHNGADGIIDEFAIFARALTVQEIQEAMKMGFSPGVASNPSPANEQTDVPQDVTLSWKPGEYADKHDVYFGTVFDDVNDASRTNPLDVLVSQNQVPNSYSPAEVLQWEQTYYWRIDEVNAPPDFTIFKGGVWQFTVEPFAYPIPGSSITATASSQFNPDTGPEKTIDGSGLDENDLHSTEEADIWLSGIGAPQPTWIQYEFDRVYKLHQMWVWNFNQVIESTVGFGFKDVTIEYSSDGANWTTLGTTHEFARAPGTPGYAANTTIDFNGVVAKYVKLTANSNWGGL